MVPYHVTQYEENPSSHHEGIHEDRLTDRWTDWTLFYIPRFRLGGAGNVYIKRFVFGQLTHKILYGALEVKLLVDVLFLMFIGK